MEEARVRELLILGRIPGFGVRRLRALVSHLGDPFEGRRADPARLARVPGLSRRLTTAIPHFFRSAELSAVERDVDRVISRLRACDAATLHLWHPSYPPRLSAICDAPPVLFVQGSIEILSSLCVAIVGTDSSK